MIDRLPASQQTTAPLPPAALPPPPPQVYLAAVRSFSHRGLEGGSRLLSVVARDGRSVHFRMPAAVSAARCGTWFEAEAARRRRAQGAGRGVAAVVGSVAGLGGTVGSGAEEIWLRGLWGAGSSEQWMERLVDEVRRTCLICLPRRFWTGSIVVPL